MKDWNTLSEFRELWFPCPRIRLPELGAAGPVYIEGGRCVSGLVGEYTKIWLFAGGRWHFYYVHALPRDFFLATMPEAVPYLLRPHELTVATFRQDLSYKVVVGLRSANGPVRRLDLIGEVSDLTECVEGEEAMSAGPLGWKLSMTHLIGKGAFHGLVGLEDGRLYPIRREGGEDVFKSSWVTFTR